MVEPDWIAVDWGTTTCRAWAMGPDGAVLAEARSDGLGPLAPGAHEAALRDLLAGWAPAPVFACGMIGSREGWVEAAYSAVPCTPDTLSAVKPPVSDPDLDVTVIGGVSQERPAEVMRGEEIQVAGCLSRVPDFEGVLCLPGTHSKWVHVSAREIVSFRTVMTGEIFALLTRSSVLRHSVGPGWDGEAFREAVTETLARPESLAAGLFSIRAEALLHGLDGASARARVSGLLIGAELAATRPYWLGQNLAIIGEETLTSVYSGALAAQGLSASTAPGDEMTREGLARLRVRLGSAR